LPVQRTAAIVGEAARKTKDKSGRLLSRGYCQRHTNLLKAIETTKISYLLLGRMANISINTGYQPYQALPQMISPIGAEKRRGAFSEALKNNTPSPTKPTPAKKSKSDAESYIDDDFVFFTMHVETMLRNTNLEKAIRPTQRGFKG